MPTAWDAIDHLIALDPGGRGIAAFFTPGAALAAARALLEARRVLITTGFAVASGQPETDGPPGAAVLGSALRRLGARVGYVTDPASLPVLEAALETLEEPADITVYPAGDGVAIGLLARERPTHMVAIERPGRGAGGDYLNARGESVAGWNRPIDELFLVTATAAAVTVGVGDGGNEIGMGNVRPLLVQQGPLMARIASIVPVDHLVVAGTSNWGAYGIAAALGRFTGQQLLHTPEAERRLVTACVRAGAVDGISRRPEATVDNLALDVHAAIVELLRRAVTSGGPGEAGAG